jgi:transcriptional regulator with XRE-family HTH domain
MKNRISSKDLALNIIRLRESVGWSQGELARKCEVTSAAINVLEKGYRYPSFGFLEAIAIAFNMSISELIGEEKISFSKKDDFYKLFGEITKLDREDQKLILSIVNRLKNNP